MIKPQDLKLIVMARVPLDSAGNSVVDLYVRLPLQNKYLRWIKAGDKISPIQLERLYHHPDPKLYAPQDQWRKRFLKMPATVDDKNSNLIGVETKEMVTDLILEIIDETVDGSTAIERLGNLTDEITNTLLNDFAKFEEAIILQSSQLARMEDSAAIRTLATMFALAAGHESRTSIQELAAATLVMDTGLLNFASEDVVSYYKNPTGISPGFRNAYRRHPASAYMMADEKLKFMSDNTLQLILQHHELHSGNGFPRGVSTKGQPKLIKIMALSVHCFEQIKYCELNGIRKDISQILMDSWQLDMDPHTRKHQDSLMKEIFSYFKFRRPTEQRLDP